MNTYEEIKKMLSELEKESEWQQLMEKTDEVAHRIALLSDEQERMRAYIDYGRFCCNRGMHMQAVDAFREVFDAIPFNSKGKKKQLLEDAVSGLWELHSSEDEYTWERTGVLFDYLDWCEEHNVK